MTAAHHGKAFHGGEHYENFPVGSWLVPAGMRSAVLALYRYARTGDDLADEADLGSGERIEALNALLDGLHLRANHQRPALAAIGQTLREELDGHDAPIAPAEDLIAAFLQDVQHRPMQTEEEVLAYCKCSANPIGRIVLTLAGILDRTSKPFAIAQASDAICTGLQLANFAQDMGQDVGRGRIYIPAIWLAEAGMRDSADLALADGQIRAALAQRMARWALRKLDEGAPLPRMIKTSGVAHRYRLALEVALALEGGRDISRQVLANPAGVWKASPAISKARLAVVVLRSLRAL